MIFDPGPWVQVSFTGPDCGKFLQGLVTADVLALKPGGGVYSLILTPKGRLRGDFDLYGRGEDLLAIASPLAGANLIKDVSKTIMLSETKLEQVRGSLCFITESLPGTLRSHICAQGGWLLAAAPTGRVEGPEAFGSYLTRQGVPLYGRDMDEQTLAQEARLDAALSFTKGCYLGQETVSRVHHMGHVNRLLCRLRLSGEGAPVGAAVFAGDEETGRLTSVSGTYALGWVKTTHAVAGARLDVRAAGSCCSAEVIAS